jgi:inner membrane protein
MRHTKPRMRGGTPLPGFPALASRAEGRMREDLQGELFDLSFLGFEHLIRYLLLKMEYVAVELTGRKHKRGRRRHSGYDLIAHGFVGSSAAFVLVQVKQYERPVARLFVEQLQGAMHWIGATHGIIVTTSTFSAKAAACTQTDAVPTINLIDGEQLIDLLCLHQVGIKRTANGRYRIDRPLFAYLHREFPRDNAAARIKTANSKAASGSQIEQMWRTVQDNLQGGHMTWRTHALAGISALWLLEPIPDALTPWTVGILAVLAAFGALLPDLDAAHSKLTSLKVGGARPFLPLSAMAHQAFGHRGLLHSLFGLAGAVVVLSPMALHWGWVPAVAVLLGYGSHLAMDALTKSGIPLLGGQRRFHLLLRGLRFSTGSLAEDVLLPVLAGLVLLLLLYHFPITEGLR